MRKSIMLIAAAALMAPATASAAGYGPAGCGLGSLIFDANSGTFLQILAATTNGSSGNQTFAITSGTSNCDGTDGGKEDAKVFIQTNRVAFSKDAARGAGETVDGLAELAGCGDSAAVGRSLQSNFGQIFPSSQVSDVEVGQKAVEVLKADETLSCSNLS